MTGREIIDRLEKLTGPSREVDAEIMAACFDWARPEPPFLAPHCVGDEPIYWHAPSPYHKREVPELTASLDAIVALIEQKLPGWRICFDAVDGKSYDTYLIGPRYDDSKPWAESSPPIANKPTAIALCICLLKAMEAGQ